VDIIIGTLSKALGSDWRVCYRKQTIDQLSETFCRGKYIFCRAIAAGYRIGF
jgi:hypothetical protein